MSNQYTNAPRGATSDATSDATDLDTACEPGCYGEDPCRLCRLRSQRDDALARLEQARTEVAERIRERDEARRLHSVLHDVSSGGCLHTMLRHEHACAVDSVNVWRTKADAAEKRATYAEQPSHVCR